MKFLLLIISIMSLKTSVMSLKPYISFKKHILDKSNNKYDSIIPILNAFEKSCRRINKVIKCSVFNDLNKELNITNVHNEKQIKVDILSNNIMKKLLLNLECVNSIISEEEEHICYNSEDGKYIVAFDPLDGSSNIKSNLPTGTIIGIYTKNSNKIIAAGYCLYSSSVSLVLSYKNSVDMFTYDDRSNNFILTKSNMKIPNGNTYSFNLENLKLNDFRSNNKNSFRYTGALVADAHNILINGGLFGYLSTQIHKNGKLRLLYEAKPISKIITDAGGSAIDSNRNILDIPFTDIHQRIPLFFGNDEEINKLRSFILIS